jgi:hypothetical protein
MMAFMSPALSFQQACALKSREAYRGPVFWMTSDDVSGIRGCRDVVRHSGSVVLPAVADGSSGPRVLPDLAGHGFSSASHTYQSAISAAGVPERIESHPRSAHCSSHFSS